MDTDQRDMLMELNRAHVDYVIVGGQAVNAYGIPRYTKDLDILIRPTPVNSRATFRALSEFGVPLSGMIPEDFWDGKTVLQIGTEPNRIDIIQQIDGLEFDQVWERRTIAEVDEDLQAPLIGVDDLILNKRSTGRPQDIADATLLERLHHKSRKDAGHKTL